MIKSKIIFNKKVTLNHQTRQRHQIHFCSRNTDIDDDIIEVVVAISKVIKWITNTKK